MNDKDKIQDNEYQVRRRGIEGWAQEERRGGYHFVIFCFLFR